ncbi:MAG: SPOR domain-containing protein, partial [Gammaproteobacteria bacterium]
AQYSLAVMHAFGRGLEQDYGRALDWFHKAAEQGVAQAQYNLGVFYENGHGVERDTTEAAYWYERAAAQGLTQAEDRLAAMDETATADAPSSDSNVNGKSATADEPEPVAGEDYDINEITPGGIRREDWVMRQSPDSYTMQIGSVVREQAIVDLIHSHGLESKSAYIKVVIDGVTRYNGLYGIYNTYEEAERAASQLTAEIGIEPWIRNIGILQKMIQ